MISRASYEQLVRAKTDPVQRVAPSGEFRKRIPTLSGPHGAPVSKPGERDRPLLTVLSGSALGMVIPVHSVIVVGRGDDTDVHFEDRTVSWHHARVTPREGRVWIEDLGSTNGTYVAGRRITEPTEIVDGDRIGLGPRVEMKLGFVDALEARASLTLYESAVRDPLTRLHNRRHLEERLRAEFSFAERNDTSLSVLMIDIDHFKSFNDQCGHALGDALLRVLALSLKRLTRPEDVLARYGGEEFVIVARDIGAKNALILAERIRERIASLPLPIELSLPQVTVSIGVATVQHGHWFQTPEELLAAADHAMYAAKASGRNRVVAA